MSEKLTDFNSHSFIEGWLNHFSISYKTDIGIGNTKGKLDFFIDEFATAIMMIEWKKPISVKIINQALTAKEIFNLEEVFIVTKQISQHALDTINRFDFNIIIVHPNGLSEIAMKFANLRKHNVVELKI